jgi:hypothetical protein
LEAEYRKMTVRVLRLLATGPATVEQSSTPAKVLLRSETGAVSVGIAVLSEMASSGSVVRKGDLILATDAGLKAGLRATALVAQYQRQHRETEHAALHDGDGPIVAEINLAESPLAQLMRRKGSDGAAFLTRGEFDAGERLRGDYTRAGMMPRLGVDCDRRGSGRARGEPGGMAEMTDAALAARQRVDRALHTVGPELSGILVDVCCFLKGLETVERERSWPARSAKMMLKAALGVLARHYDPRRGLRPRALHWGGEGYRPELG